MQPVASIGRSVPRTDWWSTERSDAAGDSPGPSPLAGRPLAEATEAQQSQPDLMQPCQPTPQFPSGLDIFVIGRLIGSTDQMHTNRSVQNGIYAWQSLLDHAAEYIAPGSELSPAEKDTVFPVPGRSDGPHRAAFRKLAGRPPLFGIPTGDEGRFGLAANTWLSNTVGYQAGPLPAHYLPSSAS